jgi:hypothetical protein
MEMGFAKHVSTTTGKIMNVESRNASAFLPNSLDAHMIHKKLAVFVMKMTQIARNVIRVPKWIAIEFSSNSLSLLFIGYSLTSNDAINARKLKTDK